MGPWLVAPPDCSSFCCCSGQQLSSGLRVTTAGRGGRGGRGGRVNMPVRVIRGGKWHIPHLTRLVVAAGRRPWRHAHGHHGVGGSSKNAFYTSHD